MSVYFYDFPCISILSIYGLSTIQLANFYSAFQLLLWVLIIAANPSFFLDYFARSKVDIDLSEIMSVNIVLRLA